MTEEQIESLDQLIRKQVSFAIYRLPGDTEPVFLMQSGGKVMKVNSVEELNGRTGFVIAPFHVSPAHPVILIQPDTFTIPAVDPEPPACRKNGLLQGNKTTETPDNLYRDYTERFLVFSRFVSEEHVEKVVLSRKTAFVKNSFSPSRAFMKACREYTRSYVYLLFTPMTGTWLGSTPELLLSGRDNNWRTIALAGAQPLLNGILPDRWDQKNKTEQQLVASYISGSLHSLGVRVHMSEPYTVRAAGLAHIRTDFSFSLPDNNCLGTVLQTLHPTPAIAGLPKAEAVDFILQHEGYDRTYYSGFLGRLDPRGKTDVYVNLRCMEISSGNSVTLYAGSGLVTGSVLEEEWQETEDKLQTMKALLN